jgi:hypothetical protein
LTSQLQREHSAEFGKHLSDFEHISSSQGKDFTVFHSHYSGRSKQIGLNDRFCIECCSAPEIGLVNPVARLFQHTLMKKTKKNQKSKTQKKKDDCFITR